MELALVLPLVLMMVLALLQVGLLAKDVKIAADLAEQIGVDNPIGRLTRDLYAEARDALGPDQDHSRAAIAWDRKARPAAK